MVYINAMMLTMLTACAPMKVANEAMLTYETMPEGATLYEAGVAIGVAPVTRTYQSDGKTDIITTPEVLAVWPSGAKTRYFTELKVGSDQLATIQRPQNAANLKVDTDNAARFILEKESAAARNKEATKRELARDSAACRDQQAKGNVGSAACR